MRGKLNYNSYAKYFDIEEWWELNVQLEEMAKLFCADKFEKEQVSILRHSFITILE